MMKQLKIFSTYSLPMMKKSTPMIGKKPIIKIAELVKALRTDAGMTQAELVEKMDTRQNAISRMEPMTVTACRT